MMTSLTHAVVAASLLLSVPAQQTLRPVAYPQDTTALGRDGNCAPFGQDALVPRCDEARVQILIPAPFLPSTGGSIHGLEVVSDIAKSIEYDRLDIGLSHTPRLQLDPVFANNLNTPQTVFSQRDFTHTYAGGDWTRLMFTSAFAYNGTDNLVIETRKRLSATQITSPTSAFMRHVPGGALDLPPMQMAIGVRGSGEADAARRNEWNVPIRVRLLFSGTPTMTVLSDEGGPFERVFALGGSVSMTAHASPGDRAIQLLDPSGVGLTGAPLRLPFIRGAGWVRLAGLVTLAVPTVDATGTAVSAFTIPGQRALVGLRIGFQSVIVTGAGELSWTCATRGFVNF